MKNKSKGRDLGHNNVVKRPHLIIYKTDIYNMYNTDTITEKLQKIVDKVEHRLDRCEEFLDNNSDEISVSYYTEGYYNGRARAYEDVIDIIMEYLKEQ